MWGGSIRMAWGDPYGIEIDKLSQNDTKKNAVRQ
jgi:hypothetical protein